MTDERDTFESTRARLEEIAAQVRKRDTSLDQSIELLEEGVRLANLCTEQVDQASVVGAAAVPADDGDTASEPGGAAEAAIAEDGAREPATTVTERAADSAGSAATDDFDMSDAWSDLDDATEHDADAAVNDSQEVLELAVSDDAASAAAAEAKSDEA
jgi:exodeoxyribonuclease VII small subunit